jgi:putative transposase
VTQSRVSYKRHRFPPQIIAHAVWLYFRFPLIFRLVEEMLLERRIMVSYETVRRWATKFGPDYARRALVHGYTYVAS